MSPPVKKVTPLPYNSAMSKTQTQWIFGIHAINSALQKHPEQIIKIVIAQNTSNRRLDEIDETAKKLGIKRSREPLAFLNRHCKDRHQDVIAVIKVPRLPDEHDLKKHIAEWNNPLILVLDNLEDPRNLGACLRSADAVGVNAVIIPKHKSASITPVTRKTAAGAADSLNIYQVTNIANTLIMLKDNGLWVTGTDCEEHSKNLYQTDMSGPLAIVMGNEGKGIRPLVKKHCDFLIHIPMFGTVQSLNVSVATGITLFETMRQRQAMVKE